MPEDYWSSQAATLAERSIGYDEGHTQGRHQGLRQGRQARADFYQRIVRLGVDGLHDGVDYARIHQKILAESLAGEMAV